MKNNEKLLDILGEVNEKSVPEVPEKRPSTLWMKLSAAGCGVCAAALLGIVILGGGGREEPPYGGGTSNVVTDYYSEQSTPDISESAETTSNSITTEPAPPVSEEPIVTLYPDFSYDPIEKALAPFRANITDIGGKGFEGESSYDLSVFQDKLRQNPWNESMVFETLPVFHNEALAPYSTFTYFTEEELKNIAANAAYGLGTEIASVEGTDADKPHRIVANCTDGTEIQVYGNGTITISFKPGPQLQLPEGYDTPEKSRKRWNTL